MLCVSCTGADDDDVELGSSLSGLWLVLSVSGRGRETTSNRMRR